MPRQTNRTTEPNTLELVDNGEDTHPESMDIPVHAAVNPESTKLKTVITQQVTSMA
jgi:hypothetical protein